MTRILKDKNLLLFNELNEASGSPDVMLASHMAKGFDLMGEIPAGGVYPFKPLHATLTPRMK